MVVSSYSVVTVCVKCSTFIFQKKAMQLQFGDATAVPDLSDAQAVSRSFPLTYGQRLVHFLSSSFGIRDSQFLTEHPVMR